MLKTYRHSYAISIDLELCKPLELYDTEKFPFEESVRKIDVYKMQVLGPEFDISYDHSGAFVYVSFNGRGKIENLALKLMPFFDFCVDLGIHTSCSSPYYMSWGDYESGAIYFETNKGHNNKAIITGISSHGDIVVNTLPWTH